jgi:HrpA-like RNA helicase
MSATADAAFFSSYLGDAPLLNVPGRTFPVHTMHLEEVEVMVGRRAAKGVSLALDAAEVDGALLLATIEHVVLNGVPGAVLVFLSGAREIERCCAEIEGSRRLREVPMRVVALHGSLPPAAQRRAFELAPPGTRKVVVATNVAETSVTISDIVHVIDSGLVKSKGWNACTRIASLRDERVSAASAAQRRGRAGRVQEGHCYRLWPENLRLMPQALPEMSRVPLEEIILELSLLGAPSAVSLLAQAPTPPSPTAVRAASQNLIELQAIELRVAGTGAGARGGAGGGLGGLVVRGVGNPNAPSYQLTPLGWHMSSLPVDPRIGKMLLLAAVCGCLHPILSVAAALSLSGRSIFLSPHGKQVDASTAQRAAFGALRSDQLALAAAYDAWVEAREEGGARAERALCDRLFLNGQALREVERGRRELLHHLISAGFVPASVPASAHASDLAMAVSPHASDLAKAVSPHASDLAKAVSPHASDLAKAVSPHASDLAKAASPHASDLALLRGIVCAALYPNVAAATRTTAQQSHACYEKLTLAGGELQAWMHPSSLNAQVEKAESGLYVFLEKVDTSRLFIRETSRVPPAALLLFGATPSELDVERVKQTGRVELGGGVRVRASPQTTLLFKLLRRELDDLLVRKARAPGTWPERDPAGVAVVETVRAVIGRFA